MISKLTGFLLLLLISVQAGALEPSETCDAKISGQQFQLPFDHRDPLYLGNTTFRELLFSGWDGACPSYVVLRQMTPNLNEEQRETFCVNYDKRQRNYTGFSLGKRDAFGRCKKSRQVCETINATKDEALALVGLGAGAVGGANVATAAAGVTAVTHSSGAVILTGSAGYLAGTLGTVATSVVSALTAPVVIVGTTVSVVAVGGAVYLCRPSTRKAAKS